MSGRFNIKKVGHDNPGLQLDMDEGVIRNNSTHELQSNFPTENGTRKTSFSHFTLEALPRPEYYKSTSISGVKRPSLGELHGEEITFTKVRE